MYKISGGEENMKRLYSSSDVRKRIYISADYSEDDGDREVVNVLNSWGNDNKHKANFIDMSSVVSGSVEEDPDCRACDLKAEFNRQINKSSIVIFIVGDKTANRKAGSGCQRSFTNQYDCLCTPYKRQSIGRKLCKISSIRNICHDDECIINEFSYLKHEFMQAVKKNKDIVIFYNSLRHEKEWLPKYMSDYENAATPFWIKNTRGEKVGNYEYFKQRIGL